MFPSRYECFALPRFATTACGTRSDAANDCSISDIAGDAALVVDAAAAMPLTNFGADGGIDPRHTMRHNGADPTGEPLRKA